MKKINELRKQLEEDEKNFDWFSHTIDTNEMECKELRVEKREEKVFYEKLISFAKRLFVLTTIAHLVTYLSGYGKYKIHDHRLITIFRYANGSIASLLILNGVLSLLKRLTLYNPLQHSITKHLKILELATLMTWLVGMYIYRNIVASANNIFYDMFSSVLKACILIVSTMILSGWTVRRFEWQFIKKSLKGKIAEIEAINKIIVTLKRYTYDEDVYSTASSSSSDHNDLFCIDFCRGFKYRREGIHGSILDDPELPTIKTALHLAKDCFLKRSPDKSEMDFESFSKLFPSPQEALFAFGYFDSDQDRSISKKEFRDTMIFFYKKRRDLELSYNSLNNFATIVKRVWYFVLGLILCFPILMIFGVSISKILTLVVSSVVLCQFATNDIMNKLIKNFIILFTHQFDIGDSVIIDGKEYTVYKIGVTCTSLTTTLGGNLKMLNSELWDKEVINMTRTPSNQLVFSFDVQSDLNVDQIATLKERIKAFCIYKIFDFHDTFQIRNELITKTEISTLHCICILKLKGFKNPSKKFHLRIEFTTFLKDLLKELKITAH